eukprot:CAMPEP_0174851468 /NCGR_PEP_ID=MMETSP1114-20130205/23209_1 /TAXON_ID=312471 /ORGANISM="Neobodo designis, Strain CCAP 1951/1" /LENGTH=245 /DNA_ID=CAMNT_0016086007 /DNA_START=56 /DNA_END=793 /DNA_ORIENTATION=+
MASLLLSGGVALAAKVAAPLVAGAFAYKAYTGRPFVLRLLFVATRSDDDSAFEMIDSQELLVTTSMSVEVLQECITGLTGLNGERFILRSTADGTPVLNEAALRAPASTVIGSLPLSDSAELFVEYPSAISTAQLRDGDVWPLVVSAPGVDSGSEESTPPTARKVYVVRSTTANRALLVCSSVLNVTSGTHLHVGGTIIPGDAEPLSAVETLLEEAGMCVSICGSRCTSDASSAPETDAIPSEDS